MQSEDYILQYCRVGRLISSKSTLLLPVAGERISIVKAWKGLRDRICVHWLDRKFSIDDTGGLTMLMRLYGQIKHQAEVAMDELMLSFLCVWQGRCHGCGVCENRMLYRTHKPIILAVSQGG